MPTAQRPNQGVDSERILREIARDQYGGSIPHLLAFLDMRLKPPFPPVDNRTAARIRADIPLLRRMIRDEEARDAARRSRFSI